jgi:hypothetical protein
MNRAFVVGLLFAAGCGGAPKPEAPTGALPVLTRASHDVATAELKWGPGSRDRVPQAPFRFIAEDLDGDSPKFSVTDARGTEWKVKLGPEAQVETAAVRLLWASGYFAEEAYYLPRAVVDGLPSLKRGREHVVNGTHVTNARFEPRRPEHDVRGNWDWARNPFVGTRELDGLRVLMVLLNNYDARAANNRVVLVEHPGRPAEAQYVVTDLGAALGRVSGMGGGRSKNDLNAYRSSRFIRRVADGHVWFAYRTTPQGWALPVFVLNPVYVMGELKKQRDMEKVPLASARWIGARLGQLSDAQLRDAFLAAYDEPTARGFADVVRDRVRQLQGL